MMKKVKWKRCLLTVLCSLLLLSGYAQTTIKGTIFNRQNEPLIGATVAVKGTSIGTSANVDGKFSLSVPSASSTVVVSFVGYQSQVVELKGKTSFNFVLEEDAKTLDQVVVVGYGTQKRQSVTGSVAAIDSKELRQAPTSAMSNMLAGRLPGLVATQRSGVPGADDAGLSIRGGGNPLVVVDGVLRDFNQLDPNEVESVTILKDASACAVYGMQAADGVILVTTKRGKKSRTIVTYSGDVSVSENTRFPEFMDGPTYAYYNNLAREMDGSAPLFSKSDVDKMTNGDPEGKLGNTNWVKEIFKTGWSHHHNVSINGGSDNVKYFLSAGYLDQKGNVEGFNFNRYNLRSNVDAKVTNNFSISLDVAGRLEERSQPIFGAGKNDYMGIIQQTIRSHPYLPTTYDGLPVGSPASYVASPLAARDLSGSNNMDNNVFQAGLTFKYDMPWVKGLSAKAAFNYDHDYSYSKIFKTPYMMAAASTANMESRGIVYNKVKSPGISETSLTEGINRGNRFTGQYSLNYSGSFGKHSFTGLALLEHSNRNSNKFQVSGAGFELSNLAELAHANGVPASSKGFTGGSSKTPRMGLVSRLTYDYDSKYLVELSSRYDGSYKFASENRWDFFPAASLGWRISNEDFFKDNISFVDNLKFRVSAGKLGDDAPVNAYQYLRYMNWIDADPIVVIGKDPVKGMMTSSYADPNIEWEIATIYNAGIEGSMWKGLLSFEIDAFYKVRSNMLKSIGNSYPMSMGGNFPSVANSGKVDYRGIDLQLSHRNKIGEVSYSARVTMNWARSRIISTNDSPNIPYWQRTTGNRLGMKDGFIALGLFQSEEEIASSAVVSSNTLPGDIKYKDLNGDGKITYDQDRTWIGKSSTPELMGGLNLTAEWRGFDFSMLFQGGAICDVALMGFYPGVGWDNTEFTRSFYSNGNSPVDLIKNSWTPNNTDAKYPRLSTISRPNNYSNTLFMIDGSYLRLKNLQFGYNFKTNWLKPAGISALRMYFTGSNLLTWSNNPFLDPEAPDVANGYYPQQRVYTFGVNLTF